MSNYLKFKEIMDGLNKDTWDTFKPNIVLAYKDKESGYGELFDGYHPLFELDNNTLRSILWEYKYLEDESKIKRINELEQDSEYYNHLWIEASSEVDKLQEQIRNLKK